jgi:hypothetical protein
MEARAALWTLVGIFVVFKLATTAMIVAASPQSTQTTLLMFVAFHWPFMLLGLVLVAAPLMFWVRLLRVRAKRAQLQAAEWRVEEPAPRA